MNIIFFLRNRGSEKERVEEEMPNSEVRKCSRLLSPVNSLIDQLNHSVMVCRCSLHNSTYYVNTK